MSGKGGDGGEAPVETGTEIPPTPTSNSPDDVPSIFTDGCIFATRLGSNVRLQFVENILEAADAPNPGLRRRHVVTLVLPLEGFQGMLAYLNEITPKFIDWPVNDGE